SRQVGPNTAALPSPVIHLTMHNAKVIQWQTRGHGWQATLNKYARKNRLRTVKGHVRVYCETPEGRKVTIDYLLDPLAKFLAGELDEQPDRPRGKLALLVYHQTLKPKQLALMVLSPLMDRIMRGWDGRDVPSAYMLLCKGLGEELRDRLALEGLLTSDTPRDRRF